MYQSHTLSLTIRRHVDEVYAFLAEPRNFPKWAAVITSELRQIGPREWVGNSTTGERVVRFCEPNKYGVVDHAIYRRGEVPVTMPMRVAANGEGCELTFIFYRRPGMTEEAFASGIVWITTDFEALRSLLEA